MIEQLLRQYEEMAKQMPVVGILERFVLKNGKGFTGSKLPEGVERGTPKECFANAFNLALTNSDYQYVEGFAGHRNLPLPIHHAWVIDGDGNVIDNTWEGPETATYWGIPLDFDFVYETVVEKHGYYGLFANEIMLNLDVLEEIDADFIESIKLGNNRD